MSKTFGILTEGQKDVMFANMGAALINNDAINNPGNPVGPNFPRAIGRLPGYQNPILGDPGRGRIGRWQFVKYDSLQNVIDQVIEHYVENKDWYSRVRCREALWNMYRRLEWWVRQQVDPSKNDYQRALLYIKDCIAKILDPGEMELKEVFEEYFNDQNNISSQVVTSPGWEWEDLWTTYNGGSGDGVMIVRNKEGAYTLDVTGISLPRGGKVLFEYGGAFKGNDKIELIVNGKSMWTGNTSTRTARGIDVEVELPPNTSELKWVYTCGFSLEEHFGWVDSIRIFSNEYAYGADFSTELDAGLTYSDGWYDDKGAATVTVAPSTTETITKSFAFLSKGYVIFSFAASLGAGGRIYLKIDGDEVWSYSQTGGSDLSFRDVRINVAPGFHDFEWGVVGGSVPSTVRIKNIEMVELVSNEEITKMTPYCPAPYFHYFDADYFNHFDGSIIERPTFDMRTLPLSNDFPAFFRWVSSTEDQEWVVVHSVGANEQAGTENILKLDLGILSFGNSSKITFNWRFKQRGFIRFKYLASVDKGNGLVFFINGEQVGGEWSQSNDWQEVSFNVYPGQTYKFDWLVRKQSAKDWGYNAVYIKDIECVETIRTADPPTPPDFDTLGTKALEDGRYEWVTYSKQSVVRSRMGGDQPLEEARVRKLVFNLDNECDGEISYSYKLDTETPFPEHTQENIFSDNFQTPNQHGESVHGSSVDAQYDSNWVLNGEESTATADGAKIVYKIKVAPEATLDLHGIFELEPPDRVIDHYEEQLVPVAFSGSSRWVADGSCYTINNITAGIWSMSTSVNMPNDGYFEFDFSHDLRPTEKFRVVVNGIVVLDSKGLRAGDHIRINLKAGNNQIEFKIIDSYTEQPLHEDYSVTYNYGNYSSGEPQHFVTQLGNKVELTRYWDVGDGRAYTNRDGDYIIYNISLNPGAKFSLHENAIFHTAPVYEGEGREIFREDFNIRGGVHSPAISFSGHWEWVDLWAEEFLGGPDPNVVHDGVFRVRNADGTTNTVYLSINLAAPGSISFEYGANLGDYETFQLWDGDVLIWSGDSTSDSHVTVPLGPGYHSLRWVYQDLGGTTYTKPPTEENPGSSNLPAKEEWWSAGNQVHPINYSYKFKEIYTPRKTYLNWWAGDDSQIFYWNGQAVSQGTDIDGATITRDITTPEYASVTLTERLKIYPGSKSYYNEARWEDVPITGRGNILLLANEGTTSTGCRPAFASISIIGKTEIRFSYNTFLTYYDAGVGNFNSRYHSGPRGAFCFYIIPFDAIKPIDLDWFDTDKFYQYRRFIVYDNRTNYSYRTALEGDGIYYLVWVVVDLWEDTNYVYANNALWYYGARILSLQKKVNGYYVEGYDDTYVEFKVVDVAKNVVLSQKNFSWAEGYIPVSYTIAPGVAVRIYYTLRKGKGTEGGINGTGGAFTLSQGSFAEYWGSYGRDVNDNYYSISPYNEIPDPPPPIQVGISSDDSWVWLDAIRVVESDSSYTDARLDVIVKDDDTGAIITNHSYDANDALKQSIAEEIVNNSNSKKTYTLIMRFRGDGGVYLNKGGFTITETKPVPPSYAKFCNVKVVQRVPIWMGGPDGSKLHVTIYDEATNAVVDSWTTDYNGISDYPSRYSNFTLSPYSNYRVEVVTEQHGTVSSVTGKKYLTTFYVHEFKAIENWTHVPNTFSSKLEFYIDGILKAVHEQSGGYYTVSFPVTKGKHEFKWVFVGGSSERNWDYAQLDWIRLTNWICDRVYLVPYCEPGGGDKCIEALIRCLLSVVQNRPQGCVVGKRIWLFT
ncbi:hypothetical protein E308F_30150 [Moorella sp. E308F]|uniref:hypothetical protein n=1 Tax=Moorella sp. E308F TaxID=2572682 RepID=UPI0010FFB38E|nr:hypothetical protein [Moorella sp. E308F]GEA16769.1 hypothetical protein E308F_30150 [Moorella sp. E308F]